MISVKIRYKTKRKTQIFGNARMVQADEGMFWILFDDQKWLGISLRDILDVEVEPGDD